MKVRAGMGILAALSAAVKLAQAPEALVALVAEEGLSLRVVGEDWVLRGQLEVADEETEVLENGAAVAPLRVLHAALRRAPAWPVELSADDEGRLKVWWPGGEYAFPGQVSEQGDLLLDSGRWTNAGEEREVDLAELAAAVRSVAWCASDDLSRPILTAVALTLAPEVAAVATDGFRVAYFRKAGVGSSPLVVPAKDLMRALAALPRSGAAKTGNSGDEIWIGAAGVTVWIRCLEGAYPDLAAALPPSFAASVRVARAAAVQAAARAELFGVSPLAGERAPVRLRWGGEKLEVSVESALVGTMAESLAGEGAGEMEILFNPVFLLQALRAVEPDSEGRLKLEFSSPLGAARVSGNGKAEVYLMPMRMP
ncbi:MAG: DNA polymerase III subunit beta [Chloroflexi bacterium]|nr:DNA polymerase III subunit beta [Chloroflexota bacterium]